jgi:hypothetical protein
VNLDPPDHLVCVVLRVCPEMLASVASVVLLVLTESSERVVSVVLLELTEPMEFGVLPGFAALAVQLGQRVILDPRVPRVLEELPAYQGKLAALVRVVRAG